MSFLTTFSGAASRTYKEAVRSASDVNVNLAAAPAMIGGVALNPNDRVLLTNQGDPSQNGLYVFQAAGSPLVRSTDANTSKEFAPGMLVPVAEGNYADKIFELATDGTINLGVTALSFQLALLPIDLTTDVTGVLPTANGGTNKAAWNQGRIVFVDTAGTALTEDSGLNWDNANKCLGVGTASPNAKLQVNNSGTQLGLSVYSTSSNNTAELYNQGTTSYTLALNSAANSATTGASLGGYFARGTLSSRAQTLANDSLLSISASGHTGSAVAGISAAIVLAADENTSALSYGGQIVFAVTPNGVASPTPQPRMVIKNNGQVGINTLTPAAELHVNGSTRSINFRSDSGSVGSPSYTFYNDITTGMYRSAANNISFATNGIERVRISAIGELRVLNLTASQLVATDASKNLQSLDTATYPSLTELSYVKGVTSGIQTQLDNKEQKGYYTRVATGINYVMSATDDYVGCTANSITVTLPLASVGNGKRVIIKDESGTATIGAISIARSGSDLIDGQTSESLTTNYESITLVSDGVSKWFII